MRKTRVVCLVVVGLLLIPFLFAAVASAEEKIKLVLSHWDGPDGNPVPIIVQKFMEDHPHIEVEVQYGTGDYFDKLVIGLMTNSAPDVFMWWDFPMLVNEGFLEDISPFLEKSDRLSVDDYFPQVMPYAGMVDGSVYGLPRSFTPRIIMYNMDCFDTAGLPYPTGDWTWDEFVQICLKLTDVEQKKFAFQFSDETYGTAGYVWSNGGDLLSPDGRYVAGYADRPETIDAVQWLADLRVRYHVVPYSGELASSTGLHTGHVAMQDNGHWAVAGYLSQNPRLRLGGVIPPHPEGKELQTVLHSSGWVVWSGTKHPEEAVMLLEYLSGPIGHGLMVEMDWALPALPSVASELDLWNDPLKRPFLEAIQYANTVHYFVRNPIWTNNIQPIFNDELWQAFTGQKSADQAMRSAVERAQTILDQQFRNK